MAALVTIGELELAVRRALAQADYPGQLSGRVREVPDRRTIRYYTTIGLVDKPAEMRGRTAFYGQRHLWQLLAIKQLQARGRTLLEIQAALAGASDATLRRLSDLPGAVVDATQRQMGEPAAAAASSTPMGREDFWAAPPSRANLAGARPARTPTAAATTAVHLKVADTVTLVIEGGLGGETLAKLQPVLENLKDILAQNGGNREGKPGKGREPKPRSCNEQEREQS